MCLQRASVIFFALLCLCTCYVVAELDIKSLKQEVAFLETFDEAGPWSQWARSSNPKYTGKLTVYRPSKHWSSAGMWTLEKDAFYGISTLLDKPFDPSNGFVLQYEIKYSEGITCGGSYIKLLTYDEAFRPEDLRDDTPYSVMFGPDFCYGNQKTHAILRHFNPLLGKAEEKHFQGLEKGPADRTTHVYTLKINADNSFEVLIDGNVTNSGKLDDEGVMDPPINAPEMIPDPSDIMPEDWDTRTEIPDPDRPEPADYPKMMIPDLKAKKPRGWLEDEPLEVPDRAAKKPEEWDEEEDGIWEAPLVPNPKCRKVGCGVWEPPKIRNPEYKGRYMQPFIKNPGYKGPYVQRKIKNPNSYTDPEPLKNIGLIGAVAFEFWSTDKGYLFDNVVIAPNDDVPRMLREASWRPTYESEEAEEAELREKKARQQQEHDARMAKHKKKTLALRMIKMLDDPPLVRIKPYCGSLIWALDTYPFTAYVIFALPSVFLIISVAWVLISDARDRERMNAAREAAHVAAAEKAAAEVMADTTPDAMFLDEMRAGEEEKSQENISKADGGGGGGAAAVASGNDYSRNDAHLQKRASARRNKGGNV